MGLIAIRKRLQIGLPPATLLRALVLSGTAYLLMHLWPVHGLAIIAKMAVVTVLIAVGFLALGELRKDEIRFFQLIVDRFVSRK